MRVVELSGRPIAITGASSGIGYATALACARAGMPVAVMARRRDRLEQLAAAIIAAGGRALAVAGDVTKPEDCVRLVEETCRCFGGLYAVFANAGQGLYKPIAALTDSEVREVFEVNFFGTLHVVQAALPRLVDAGSGHILVCSSCLSRLPMPGHGVYSATKAAQEHVTRALRVELHGTGVYASSVHPVGTETEFAEAARRRAGIPFPPRRPSVFVQPAERVACAVVRCLRRPCPEVWTSQAARIGLTLLALLPRLGDRLLPRLRVPREP